MTKKKILGMSLLVFLGIIAGGIVFLMECNMFVRRDSQFIMRMLCDAFFVPGTFFFCVWLTGFIKRGGLIDFIYLAYKKVVQLIRRDFVPRGCRKAYRKFSKESKEDNRCMWFMLGIALAFLGVALTFLLIDYV